MRAKIDQGVGTSAANVGNTSRQYAENTFSVWTTLQGYAGFEVGLGCKGEFTFYSGYQYNQNRRLPPRGCDD